jgi:hypothetical protein
LKALTLKTKPQLERAFRSAPFSDGSAPNTPTKEEIPMIEVIRATGGFQFVRDGAQAVSQAGTELRAYLETASQMDADAKETFADRFAGLLTNIDKAGLMRSFTLGAVTFRTGR